MTIKEIMDSAKDLVGQGKLEEARTYVEDHKDELGDSYEKAMDLINGEPADILNKIKDLFN
ncbi:hypothetical protein [Lentilactobacillus senioris]|uniref:hypothetical protein n=1 Tax=Lentilactobacillus senioris TaxID=931534 RepID=UPI003D28DFFB